MADRDTAEPAGRDASSTRIRLGTRGSALARWQAEWVAARLRESGIEVELILISTQGDVTDKSLSVEGGQGLFTKEIQRALLDGRVDLGVHSLKDLPTQPVAGLTIAAVPTRESPWDVLVTNQASSFESLPAGACIGTGSRRRQSQLLYLRPEIHVSDIRGNVDSRLRKLDAGQFDAIVLAEAGLKRLGWDHRITQVLPVTIMFPAVGQGALGLEIRADDKLTFDAVKRLNDPGTFAAVLAERTMLNELGAGCLAPVGAWGRVGEGRGPDATLSLSGVVLSPDGRQRISIEVQGSIDDPQTLGRQAASELRGLGATELIGQ